MTHDQPDTEMIYRFRHFQFTSEDHAKEPDQIICESKLWCSDPRKFNDPFDCAPNFILTDIPVEEQVKRVENMVRRRKLPQNHPLAVKAMQAARDGKFNSPEMHEVLPIGMQASIHASSVCCFNTTWDDPRMWAQYADNHRGYCLGFELDGDWPEDAVPMHVKYTHERPQIDLSVDTMADKDAAWRYVEDSIFTKSHHWEGEREVRAFRAEVPPGLLSIPTNALKVIYLGIDIDPTHRERLLAAAQRRDGTISVYQLRPNKTKYDFDLELLLQR